MFLVSVGEYQICCQSEAFPDLLGDYQQRATLVEDFGVGTPHSTVCFVGVGRQNDWPFLIVTQRYAPTGYGFSPGVLLVPETHTLFVGAGTRLLGYDLSKPARLWQDQADTGFWSWGRFGPVVLMAAELELAAWDVSGRKLWSRFVEPPWEYTVTGDAVRLDVMGEISHLRLLTGEPH